MLALPLIAVLAAAAPSPVPYAGRTGEGRRVVVTVAGGHVVRVRAGVRRYRCETFGDVGPVVVDRRGRAPVSAAGRFTFSAGPPAERLTVTGRLARGRRGLAGTLRLRGTIATGQACTSRIVRFTANR